MAAVRAVHRLSALIPPVADPAAIAAYPVWDMVRIWHLDVFATGFVGAASVELLLVVGHYHSNTPLPDRYGKAGYWIARGGNR